MPPTPSFASLHYGLPYSIWQAITISSNCSKEQVTMCDQTEKSDIAISKIFEIVSPSGSQAILVFFASNGMAIFGRESP